MSESKQKWTPGPWELAPWGDLIGSNGDKVVFAGDGFAIGSRSNSTWKANGDISKAAPELVEALQSIAQYGSDTLSGRTDGPDDRDWQREAVLEMTRRARAALAKVGA
ncbi:hypothetical protein [Burkholderia gladioli]|uniref:hypothetical protein n=1 Tax=Burkholderia gladioli TaxID=28095 RepID=UPI0030171E12